MNLQRSLCICLVLLLFFGIFGSVLSQLGVFVAPAEANPGSSWLSGWSYRKSHVVNPASGAGTNYQIGVRVDYNYTAYYDLSTAWTTISGNPVDRHNFEPVHKTNILEVDKVVDGATRKYLAYDCDPTGSQIRLYCTDDLSGSWTPYSGNPILSAPGTTHYCWPAVVYDGTTFHMFVEDNTDGGIKIYTSIDGITFIYLENVVVATTTIYMDPFPWFNPSDNRWYLYHQLYSTYPDEHQLLVRNSTTIAGLTTATDEIVLTGGGFGAPSVMYRDGYYWLLAESGETGTWEIHAFRSSSPSSNFLETANSPVLSGNEACPVSLLSPDGTTAYLFTTHLSGGTWYEETRQIYSTRASSPSNNSEVNLNSLCRTDFGDIRFTSSDGSTLLNYWMESKVDSNYATFWVEITNDLSSSPATIYAYYGKSDATTTSSGAGTFLLFDDFNDGSLGAMWTVGGTGGSVSESGGTVTITAPSAGETESVYSTTSFGLNSRVVARASRVITASGDPSAEIGFRSADGLYRAMGGGYQDSSSPNFYIETRNGSSVADVYTDLGRDNSYHVFYVMRTSSSAVDLAINSMATHNVRSTTNIPTGDIPAMALSYNSGVNIVDWIAVTKYVSPEPTQGGWESVQAFLSVNTSPSSASLDVGQSQLFTATITGSAPPYTCQWYLNSSKISGANSSTYTFTPLSIGYGSFYANVTDSLGDTAVSATVSVTVSSDPSVSVSPSSVGLDYNNPSQSQLFTATTTGGLSPYSYQWCLNGAPISGAASSTYTFTPTSSQAGLNSLYVNITDTNNYRAKSNTATISVSSTPSVSISPSSVTLDVGQTGTFTSNVSGGASPFTYQWILNGAQVGTSSSYTFTPSIANSYTLYLNVTDQNNYRVKSDIATVTVNPALSVSIAPTLVTMDVGQSHQFTSTVSGGTSPYTYQWYLNGGAVSGATGSSWIFTPNSTGSYNVYANVTDSVSLLAKSNIASVNANSALSVTVWPSSVVMDVGQSQLFSSSVVGGISPYMYQWYLNGAPVSGATNPTWTFTPVSSGYYTVYLTVNDNLSEIATSSISMVTVNPQLAATIGPSSAMIYLGQSQTFTSSLSGGTPPYSYQWYLNDAMVPNATSSSWVFTPSSSGSYNIYVNATDNVGVIAKSNIASVTVNPSLSVTVSPSSVVLDVGQSQQFTSTVSGGISPYTYQWYLNGSPVYGATSSSWTFTPTSTGTCQIYVQVTDNVGKNATSNTATLTVNSHDVAATDVSYKNAVVEGGDISVNITVKNEGNYTETFNVTLYGKMLYGNAWPIYTFTDVTLAPGSTTTLTISVDFSVGFYTLSAYAWSVPGETHTSDNIYTGVTVLVAPIAHFRPWINLRPIAL